MRSGSFALGPRTLLQREQFLCFSGERGGKWVVSSWWQVPRGLCPWPGSPNPAAGLGVAIATCQQPCPLFTGVLQHGELRHEQQSLLFSCILIKKTY